MLKLIDSASADIPASHLAAGKGLPPARARLAALLDYRQSVARELEELRHARLKLDSEIGKLESALAKAEAALNAEADRLAASFRRSVASFFGEAATAPAADSQNESRRLSIAKRAAIKLDSQIETLATRLEQLENQIPVQAKAALRELAADIGSEYAAAILRVRQLAIELEGLDVATGRGRDGRLVGELPGFAVAGHRYPVIPVAGRRDEISAAVNVWQAAERALLANPAKSPALRFDFNSESGPDCSYDQLTSTERRIVDLENAHAPVVSFRKGL